jgi:probable HAF family extracellular repeat protein
MKKLRLLIVACVTLVLAPLVMAQKQHAFIWDSTNGMTDLGTLGGNTSNALGINDSGQVVGWSYLADNITYHAFKWTPTRGMVDLGTPGGRWSQASAINSAGEAAGQTTSPDLEGLPFYWSARDGFVHIGLARQAGNDFAFGINDQGEVTGQFYTPDGVVHAFVWSKDLGRPVPIGALPGGLHSVGTAINNLRHITGNSSTVHTRHDAFVWDKLSGMRDIGVIAGGNYTTGEAINDRDEIVGLGFDNEGRIEGFYWSQSTGMTFLETLGGTQSACFAINQSGSFTGYSANATGSFHAALWPNHGSAPLDLGTLPGGAHSYGQGINNLGQEGPHQ